MTVVRGYHGTTRAAAEDLLAGKAFEHSVNPGDWLGRGIYFWQDAPERARVWAKFRNPGVETAVIAADIELGRCLDLVDVKAAVELRRRVGEFEAFEARTGVLSDQPELRVEAGRVFTSADRRSHPTVRAPIYNNRDLAFLDWYIGVLANRGLNIETVRCPFLDGKAVFTQSFLFDWSHVQISVIAPKNLGALSISWTSGPIT